jgi:hypothetical protein
MHVRTSALTILGQLCFIYQLLHHCVNASLLLYTATMPTKVNLLQKHGDGIIHNCIYFEQLEFRLIVIVRLYIFATWLLRQRLKANKEV